MIGNIYTLCFGKSEVIALW